MDAAPKNRIPKRFLEEKSTTPEDVALDDPALEPYAAMDALPKDNYFARPTIKAVAPDAELISKIMESRSKLYALTQSYPEASEFDPADIREVSSRITLLERLIKPLAENDQQIEILNKRLNILHDLNKINQLERLNIPQDNGPSLPFCTLTEAAAGVTEKVLLISIARVKLQLGHICANDALTVDNYNENRSNYKLDAEAFLKLPKRGAIKEVQREAMALNISRMMGLETSRSTTVSHNGRPALFVLFDTIRLLSDFASGKTFTAGLGITGKTYTHYSTIKPVGCGIQADRFINDFGNSLALFYLCSDTDAVGGYCQNKALLDARTLYIFDQVLMSDDKFILDSRLCLQPAQFLMKHTRHGQGRNRTLIEDSSMITKYSSLMQLKSLSDRILQYVTNTAGEHHLRAEEINATLRGILTPERRNQLNDELADISTLEMDALLIKAKIQERINNIDDVLPKTTGFVRPDEVKHALILEKLIHNPVLFSDDGRAYRNPWTNSQENPVQSINDLGNGSVSINFKSKVPPDMIDFIKRQGGCDSLTLTSSKVITISSVHLNALREDMLHPENTIRLAQATDYLIPADLSIIKTAYGEGHRTPIINCISSYRSTMNKSDLITGEKLECIINTEHQIREYIKTAKDKGFGMHVLKKFYFDAQQQMQQLMNPLHVPMQLNEGFAAALKLDRVAEFHTVVLEALAQKKLRDPQFINFITYCILREAAATNHSEAIQESLEVSVEANRVIAQLKCITAPVMPHVGHDTPEGLIHINKLDEKGCELFSDPVNAVQNRPNVTDESVVQEGIKINF